MAKLQSGTTVYGNANVNTYLTVGTYVSATGNIYAGNTIILGSESVTGNITGNYFIGNGSQLTGITAGGSSNISNGNSNVSVNANANVTVGITGTSNIVVIASTGEYVTGVVSASGNVTAGNVLTAGLMSSTGNAIHGNITTAGLVSATGNATAGNILTTGLVSASGNVYANSIISAGGTGGNITGANLVSANIFSATGNVYAGNVTATGNVQGNYILGNGALLTGVSTSSSNINSGNSNVTIASANANVTVSVSTIGNVAVFAPTGVSVLGTVIANGNITGGNVLTAGLMSSTGNAIHGNILTAGLVSATGNVYGNNIVSGGGTGGNITGANIISGNTFNAVTVSASGNITGNYFIGNGSLLTGISSSGGGANIANGTSNVTVVSSGGNVTTGIGGTANVIVVATTGQYITGVTSASGNATAGNILTAGLISATGNINAGNVIITGVLVDQVGNLDLQSTAANGNINLTPNGTGVVTVSTQLSAAGNVTGGNIATAGIVNATGNVYANTFIATGSGGFLSGAGNIIGGNILTGGLVSATGNAIAGNVLTAGLISATGNVTGNYIIGNGSLLTSLTGANITGTVANATYALSAGSAVGTAATVTTNAQPNITSVGTLSSVTASGLISTTGNVVGNYIIGNGALLTNINASNITGAYGNSNVAAYLPTYTGNLTAGNISVSGSTTVANITISGDLITGTGPTLTIDPNGSGGTDGNVVITGNLTVQGTTTTINSNTITTNDLQINMANNAANATAANNGGIGVGPVGAEYATLLYNTASNVWIASLGISSLGNITTTRDVTGGNILTTGFVSATGNATAGNVLTAGLVSATGNITGGNANITGTTASTSKTTGALKVAGGIGVAGDVYAGNSVVVDGGAYGNVTTTQFASVFGAGGGPNPYSVMQVRSSDGVSGLGMQAYTGSGILYGNTAITFVTGATIRDRDVYSGGTTRAYLDSTGLTVTGIANISGNVTGGNVLTTGLVSAGGNITSSTNIIQTGTGNINGYNGYFSNNLTVLGTFQSSNNITSNAAGIFYGNSVTGNSALYAGVPGFTPLGSNVVVQFAGNANSYSQFNFQNINTGTLASTDMVLTASNGNDSTYFADFGITSNNHSDSAFFGDTSTINDTYLFTVATSQAGPSTTSGPGNLILGSTNGQIKLFVGNTAQANVIQQVSSIGIAITGVVSATGNVTGNYFIGNGSQLTGISSSGGSNISNGTSNVTVVSSGGNVTTGIGGTANVIVVATTGQYITGVASVSGNATAGNILTAGQVSATGNIYAGNILSNGYYYANGTPFGSVAYTRTSFTATASQTTFSVTYTVGYIQVFVNGVLLNSADYTATNGTSVVLSVACNSGDIVETVAFNTVSVATTGSVLQVVQATLNGQTSFSSPTSFTQTNLTASITPTYNTSKILIIMSSVYYNGTSGQNIQATIYRDNTTNISPNTSNAFPVGYSTSNIKAPFTINYLDSPATTSSTSYTCWIRSSGGNMDFGDGSGAGTIILMEIAG